MENAKGYQPIESKLNIILAEDDQDDQLLFEEAIHELPVSVKLKTFSNGEELMEWLTDDKNKLPDALYLDLNMPRKNGFATLGQIKRDSKLKYLPVFIFSTTTNSRMIKQVFRDAAHYYIRKPGDFQELKKLMYKSFRFIADKEMDLPGEESFVLTTN